MYIYNIGSILQPKRCIIFTWICLHLQFLYFNHSFPCSWSCSCAKTMYILEPRIESNGQIITSTKKIALNRMTVLSRYMQHISQNSWFNRSIIFKQKKKKKKLQHNMGWTQSIYYQTWFSNSPKWWKISKNGREFRSPYDAGQIIWPFCLRVNLVFFLVPPSSVNEIIPLASTINFTVNVQAISDDAHLIFSIWCYL